MQLSSRLFSFSIVFAIILIGIHEYYFRAIEGYEPALDDVNVDYWADQRAYVDDQGSEDVIIIGSSRAHFNINIHLWDSITGTRPLMLAYPGGCPLPALDDIVKKSTFNGLLVIGVAPGLFFSLSDGFGSMRTNKVLDQYYDRTYAQVLNHHLYKFFDSHLGYVNESLSLKNLFEALPVRDRDSVKSGVIWPPFVKMDAYRNIRMLPIMENDSAIQQRQKDIWFNPDPKNKVEDSLQVILDDYIELINTFKKRGGRVAFIRGPVTGYYLETEPKLFPRNSYWDKLIQQSKCPGYHYSDHPKTKNMIPPEWSHLNRKDSDIYTQTIINLLKQDNLL